MKTHRLFVVVALVAFTWGCGSNTQSDGVASSPPGANVTALSGSDTLMLTSKSSGEEGQCRPNPNCDASLSASPPSPEPSGTPILLTADAGCAVATEYRFLYKAIGYGYGHGDSHGDGHGESCCDDHGHGEGCCDDDDGDNGDRGGSDGHGDGHGCGPWIELRGWGAPTFSFDTTGINPGRYLLRAQSRADREHGKHESRRTIVYKFTTACVPGYHSDGAGTCVDINECSTANGGCDPLTVCTNTPGSRVCGACPSGYSGTGDTACTDIDECLTANGGCDSLTACTNLPGSRSCGPCPSGYDGNGEIGCVDIDECLIANGGCDPLTGCTNTPGGRVCGPCPSGYTGTGDTACIDIDECLVANGGCDPLVVCTNLPGSRSCGACPSNYTGTGDTACMLPFIATELVGRPTDHSVTINAMAGQALEAYFEHGTASGVYAASTAPAAYSDGIIQTVLDGLSPDTRYYYRLRYRPSGSAAPFQSGNEYTFHTQRLPSSTFTFAVQSDSHQGYASFYNDALYRVTMGNIVSDQPDFLVDLGDTVSTDDTTETQATVRQKYLNQRTVFDLAAHSMPVFLALGNHENEEGWNLDDFGADRASSLPVLGANGRKRFFLNPVPDAFYTGNTDASVTEIDGDHLKGDYYAFEWGDALFVVIDPFWYTMKKPFAGTMGGEKNDEVVGNRWDWTLGDQQYHWLKQTLESSTAKFKFVFAHQATGGTDDYIRAGALGAKYCEWGGYNVDGTTWAFESHRPGWDLPIHQIFMRTGVSAFFHGHDHVFAKEVLDGIVYQELPHAANPDYGTGFSANTTSDYKDAVDAGSLLPNSGHLRITVAPTGATVEYVRSFLPDNIPTGATNGQVSYSYVIPPFAERDSDGDGTNDSVDGCPSNSTKTAPGVCGCGKSDTDSDGDGTVDCKDGCPNDPLKLDSGLCGCGHDDSAGCDRFMVVRVGDGNAALSLLSTAAFIEERRLDDGTLLHTTPLPTADSLPNRALTLSGSAPVEGTLKRSADGHFVTVAGYGVSPGQSNVAYTATSTVSRVIGRVAADRTVDTTTAFTSAAFDGGASNAQANDRAVASYDGSAFWVSGAGANNSGGIWYISFGATSGTQITGQSGNNPGNVRLCGIFNGQLYASTNVAPFFGVFSVGTGLPADKAPATLLTGFPTSGSSSPVDFAVLDRDPNIAGVDTIYLADDRATASGGGIQKWTFNGTTWTLAYTLKNGLPTGVRHLLAIEIPNDGVLLLAGTTSTPSNAIVKVVDTGSGSTATSFVSTLLPNTAFRGLASSPIP